MTDKQVRRLFALGKVETNLETAAAKAGMDAKTARKYRRLGRVPSELTPGPRWRTREDCFQEVWEEVQSLLEVNPGLEAKTIFEYLQRRYAGRFADGLQAGSEPNPRHVSHALLLGCVFAGGSVIVGMSASVHGCQAAGKKRTEISIRTPSAFFASPRRMARHVENRC